MLKQPEVCLRRQQKPSDYCSLSTGTYVLFVVCYIVVQRFHCSFWQFHEGTFKIYQVQLPDHCRASYYLKKILSVLPQCHFNTDRHGASATSVKNLFRCLVTLTTKKFFLTSSLKLPWCSSVPFPCILSSVTGSRDRHLPLHVSSSGGCTEQWGRPSASCSGCPQPLLTGRAFLPLYKLCCPPLEAFKDFNVLFLSCSPEPQQIFKVRLHQP